MAKPRRQFKGKTGWTTEFLPDLTGKVFVITGGNSGIGFEAARVLGRRCATVILLCRDMDKARDAIDELERASPANSDYRAIHCDLADLASIREAAGKVRGEINHINGLVANAGLMMVPELTRTADGFEMQFGVNHLGHFALASLLCDLVEDAAQHHGAGRFVTVSSLAHERGQIDFDDINHEASYSAMRAYSQSKLANLMFAIELQRRLSLYGCKAKSVACHPGVSDTNITSTGPSPLTSAAMMPFITIFAQTARKGAIPTVLAAAGPEAEPVSAATGYYGPTGFQNMAGPVDRAEIKRQALDEEAARRLWAMSEAMTGVTWPIFQSRDAA